MNPEIKAAIKKEAEKFARSIHTNCKYPNGPGSMIVQNTIDDFTAGAEYGYKLGISHGRYLERTYSGGAVTRIEQLKKELQELLDEK